MRWCRRWLAECFGPIEARLSAEAGSGRFCHGDQPSFADTCLAPQVLSARRFGLDLAHYPTVRRIYEAGLALEAFQRAMPDRQPDAE